MGEADGLSRATYFASDYVYSVKEKVPISEKPMVMLPAVTHSQFCNYSVRGDISPPFISLQDAQNQIVAATAAFLTVRVSLVDPSIPQELVEQSKLFLQNGHSMTGKILNGFIQARAIEESGDYCSQSQVTLMKRFVPADKLAATHVFNSNHPSLVDFVEIKPTIKANSNKTVTIITDSHNSYSMLLLCNLERLVLNTFFKF